MKSLFIQICILTHMKQIWTKSSNRDIDEFINRLLSSDKFNELADKIAEKAARKIFDLDHIRLSDNMKNQNDPPVRSKHKTLRENDNKEEPTTEKKDTKIKQVIKNDFIAQSRGKSSKELRLKYKNLSKTAKKVDKEEEIPVKNNTNEIQRTQNINKYKSRFEKINNQKTEEIDKKSEMSSEEKKHSNEEKGISDNNSAELNRKSKKQVSDEKVKSISTEVSKKDNNHETRENKKNDSKDKSQHSVEMVEKSKEKQTSKEDSSKEENVDETEHDNKETSKDIRKSYSMSTRRLIIRREGDKLYAFENSPDYKEYQEKIAQQNVEEREVVV